MAFDISEKPAAKSARPVIMKAIKKTDIIISTR